MKFKASLLLCCLVTSVSSAKTPLVLLSIDGFAQRYIEQYQPKALIELMKQGTSAEALLPVYPSKTFPNHLSIVTGQYPINHGIIHNSFYHREIDKAYKMGDGINDERWLNAKPIWHINEIQGNRSAVYFWPESEAPINNQTPSYFYPYQHSTPNQQRFEQILNWLRLPEAERPNFIAGYFASIDDAGHQYGENSSQLIDAIKTLDKLLLDFVQQINQEFDSQVNLVIVSDHGMTKINKHQVIDWKQHLSQDVKVVNGSTQLFLYSENNIALEQSISLFNQNKSAGKQQTYRVYQYPDYPQHWHFNHKTAALPNVIIEALPPYVFKRDNIKEKAETHGYDGKLYRDLDAIFIAAGPAFSKNKTIAAFENIHVLPIITRALRLNDVENIDGDYKIADKIVN